MKQDKTTIDISNESLNDAANNYAVNGNWKLLMDSNDFIRDEAFKAGATWQAQKDKAIQDKLLGALELLLPESEKLWLNSFGWAQIEEAKRLLNQLKQN